MAECVQCVGCDEQFYGKQLERNFKMFNLHLAQSFKNLSLNVNFDSCQTWKKKLNLECPPKYFWIWAGAELTHSTLFWTHSPKLRSVFIKYLLYKYRLVLSIMLRCFNMQPEIFLILKDVRESEYEVWAKFAKHTCSQKGSLRVI